MTSIEVEYMKKCEEVKELKLRIKEQEKKYTSKLIELAWQKDKEKEIYYKNLFENVTIPYTKSQLREQAKQKQEKIKRILMEREPMEIKLLKISEEINKWLRL